LIGPSPDIDVVLSVLLQSSLPVAQNVGKAGAASDLSGVRRSGLNQNGSVHRPPRDGQSSRRRDIESKLSVICLISCL
jgi:cleavage stimulation factor subunit 3